MAERYIIQTSGVVDHAYHDRGTLEEWQHEVARYAVGNSRLILAISTAFAAPLLYPTFSESGGFHFRGGSSTGKTTALQVAGSVWGGGGVKGFIRTWRATSNGLESVAALHCDALLCLDEMGQVDGREAGAVAYMLSNGVGKTRAGRGGEARASAEWRLLFLSSGELSLADKIAEDGRGKRVAAGQQVRIVDIGADAGRGHGLFETLHGFASGDVFSRHLKQASNEFYGTAAPAFLRLIVKSFDDIAPTVIAIRDEFIQKHSPKDADGQVSRVAARFGLAAAGGEMAAKLGIVPWPAGIAIAAAARCLKDWLHGRGGTESGEEQAAIAAVRKFIELHGMSRFEPMGNLINRSNFNGDSIPIRITNRAGFRRSRVGPFNDEEENIEHIILPEVWKAEVCQGLDPTAVAQTLAERGMLLTGKDGKPQTKQRLPGFEGTTRCYVVTPSIMNDDASSPDEFG